MTPHTLLILTLSWSTLETIKDSIGPSPIMIASAAILLGLATVNIATGGGK